MADNGGMSGTGISQGEISAFGSIFVGGVRWTLPPTANIEVDGAPADESALRVGMIVTIEGDFDPDGATGRALAVRFEPELRGPIASPPVETSPGAEKRLTILGRTVFVDAVDTVFDAGANYDSLATDDVLEISGLWDPSGALRATRVASRGTFPALADAELGGRVSNLVQDPSGDGIFDIGSVTVRFEASTLVSEGAPVALANGDRVTVEGSLRPSGDEIDAERIEIDEEGLGEADLARAEIEGFVANCPTAPDFCVRGVRVDASMATFEPIGFVPVAGDRVEVEGPVFGGILRAESVEDEGGRRPDARIRARVTARDGESRTLTMLGVTVRVDDETRLRDESEEDDESFMFSEIALGDYLEVRGFEVGGILRARLLRREDGTAGEDDVVLRGPVTALDPTAASLSILGRSIPIGPGTLYFDLDDTRRSETEFFRDPGDVGLGDVASAKDEDALDLTTFSEVDEIALED